MPEEMHSHGRGGAANIGNDPNQHYVDAGIVREGVVGDQGDGPFSTGRGGQGNIGATKSPRTLPADAEVVPETDLKLGKAKSQHVGRGGAGNEFHAHSNESEQHGHAKGGLLDKVKAAVGNK